jgi:membrane protease YdiL (CAAX protease family)
MATVMTWREQGRRAAAELWRRVGDIGRAKSLWWTLIAFLFMPAAMLISYALTRLLGLPLPAILTVVFSQAPIMFAAFFFGAILEEVGWTGYATEPLQERYGVFGAGLMIGAVWALWHIVPWWIVLGTPLHGSLVSRSQQFSCASSWVGSMPMAVGACFWQPSSTR